MVVGASSILIVEPDTQVKDLLLCILEGEGYEVATASSLDEAAEILVDRSFDAIITEALDQHPRIPFDPGFLAELRAYAPTTPVILCSTYAPCIGPRSARLGLAGALGRPFDIDDLLAKVGQALRLARPQQNAA